MKKTKLLLLILMLSLGLLFAGCNPKKEEEKPDNPPIPGVEYNVEYFVNGNKIDLKPNIYEQGSVDKIPTPLLLDYQVFDGWYLNSDYTGTTISTFENQKSNLKLYAKIYPVTEEEELAVAFKETSYKMQVLTDLVDVSYDETYYVDNNKYKLTNGIFDQYLGTVDNEKRYYYADLDNKMYYVPESSNEYIYYAGSFIEMDFSKFDRSKFIKDGDTYTVSEDYLQVISKMCTLVDETFSSFKLTILDNKVNLIEIKSNVDGVVHTYKLKFSDYGQVKVDLPTNAKHYLDTNEEVTVSEIYDLNEGDAIIVSGKVTGSYGNNFYITDNTGSILVYMGKNSSFKSKTFNGNNISIIGEVGTFSGVYQITNVTEVKEATTTFDINPTTLTSLKPSNLVNKVHEYVNVSGLQITTVPTIVNKQDINITCKADGEKINLFISKHLDSSTRQKFESFIKTLTLETFFDLNNVHVGKHKDEYQLILTDESETIIETETNAIKGIELSPSSITCGTDLTLQEILDSVTINLLYRNGTVEELDKQKVKVDGPEFKQGQVKNYDFVYTYEKYTATLHVAVRASQEAFHAGINSNQYETVKDKMGYEPSENKYYGFNTGMPSIGKPRALVLPIEFTDCKAPKNMQADLQKAFFGTPTETGWESLQSYYNKSSYGKLNIEGTVLAPYNVGHPVSYYDGLQKQFLKDLDDYVLGTSDKFPVSPEVEMIRAALGHYDATMNLDNYDTDSDGYIDAIYVVYANNYNNYDNDSLWWAFTTEYQTEYVENYDNVEAGFYVFMSYQFLTDDFHGKDVTYNTETIIHETGHLMGLNDYYDYDPSIGPDGGVGGGDMMHNNLGDHNPYSKVMLGWIDPLIVTNQTITIDLNSFGSSGESIFIFKNWQGSFFEEYYVIDFYTPDGLNAMGKGDAGLFSIPGIRILHVDSTLNNKEDCFSVYEVTKYNNSDTDHLQIKLVEADGRNDIEHDTYSTNSDLFTQGKSFNNSKWYDNTLTGFSVIVNSITSTKANITIQF